jgi:hypothetical protein
LPLIAERIEPRRFFSRFRSAHAFVAIDLNDLQTHARGGFAKFALVVLGGLMVS